MLGRMLLCAALLSGCVRLGFREPIEAGIPETRRDAGVDRSDSTSRDLRGDLGPAGLNESCLTRVCGPGLVCTGAEQTRFCRPVCDGGGCAETQVCGRPVIGGSFDPSAPLACITSLMADELTSCKELPCKVGLGCIKGSTDPPVCFRFCVTDSHCGAGRICLPVTTSGASVCMPTCGASTPCPSTLACAGLGPYPINLCVPALPIGEGAICEATSVCGPNMRCLGQLNQPHRCYRICPSATDCSASELCVKDTENANSYCLRSCSLFDNPSPCASHEVCNANGVLGKSLCIPGPGDPVDCSTRPCTSGKICVEKLCRTACDETHPCTGILKCVGVNGPSGPTPWKVCN